MRAIRLLAIASASVLVSLGAAAHHSTTSFDLHREITMEGVVRKLEWTNPHVYVDVETKSAAGKPIVWGIEAQPPAGMAREGWSADSLEPGDHVIVVANPSRNPNRRLALGHSVLKDDGTRLHIPQLTDSRVGSTVEAPPLVAHSLSGRWIPRFDPAVAGGFLRPRASWSLTPRGIAAMESYDESVNPGNDCVPEPVPYRMIWPLPVDIEVGRQTTTIRYETGETRIVHMNGGSHDGAAYTYFGHSLGSWDGDALVVDTNHFAEHRRGNAPGGLASGRQKHLVERFELAEDGTYLSYSFLLEDPEYLAEPVRGTLKLAYRPDFEFVPKACDLASARRYLEK